MVRQPDSGKTRRTFLESTDFPALFQAAYERWRARLPASEQRRAQTVMANRLGLSDTKNIRNWMQGVSAPASPDAWAPLRALLAEAPANAEHLPALDAAFAQARNIPGPDPAAAARARSILQASRAPAGIPWVSDNDQPLRLDTSPAATDVEAAARPDVAERHANVARKLRTLLRTLGKRLDNYRGWEEFRPAVEDLIGVLDCQTTELPNRMVSLYDAMVSVASFIDQDNSIAGDPKSLFEGLPPDIRRGLGDAMATGAPWVRVFPSARAADDEAGSFLTRRELFEPLRQLLQLSQRELLIADGAAIQLENELKVAQRSGFQAQKAGNRAIGTMRNLIGAAGYVLVTVYLGAIGSEVQQGSALAKSAGRVFIQAETAIRQLIADRPPDYRAAIDLAIAANKAGKGDEPHPVPGILSDPPKPREWPPRTPFAHWHDRIPGMPEDTCPEMVTMPAGHFTMGAPRTERDSDDDERPQREVTVPLFALGRYAVTFAQWDAARTDGAPLPDADDEGWEREDRPVINVSWHDAQTYCDWLNRRLGLQSGLYRLPSEAEWEYACRAGTTTPFNFGATISTDQANYDGNFTYGRGRKGLYREKTVPVGSLPANHWGLHEMHGNVDEWCEDAFGPYPARATGATPLQHKDERWRVLRGGSWNNYPGVLRSAFRFRIAPELRNYNVGFRVARTPGS